MDMVDELNFRRKITRENFDDFLERIGWKLQSIDARGREFLLVNNLGRKSGLSLMSGKRGYRLTYNDEGVIIELCLRECYMRLMGDGTRVCVYGTANKNLFVLLGGEREGETCRSGKEEKNGSRN